MREFFGLVELVALEGFQWFRGHVEFVVFAGFVEFMKFEGVLWAWGVGGFEGFQRFTGPVEFVVFARFVEFMKFEGVLWACNVELVGSKSCSSSWGLWSSGCLQGLWSS